MSLRIRRLAVALVALAGLGATAQQAAAAPTGHPVPKKPLKTITVHAFSGHTYVLKVWAIQHGGKVKPSCTSLAYGAPVQAYVKKHTCNPVSRYLVTTTVNGHAVGFAQSATGFPGSMTHPPVSGFVSLVNARKGNFRSLFTDGYRTPSGPQLVPNANMTLALEQDSGVVVVSAWYLKGSTSSKSPALKRMIQDLYLQWFA